MENIKFINSSDLVFSYIGSEDYREYTFPNGEKLFIINPLYLHVSKSGGHRVFNNKGISYYIKPAESWYILWSAKEGKANFAK